MFSFRQIFLSPKPVNAMRHAGFVPAHISFILDVNGQYQWESIPVEGLELHVNKSLLHFSQPKNAAYSLTFTPHRHRNDLDENAVAFPSIFISSANVNGTSSFHCFVYSIFYNSPSASKRTATQSRVVPQLECSDHSHISILILPDMLPTDNQVLQKSTILPTPVLQ